MTTAGGGIPALLAALVAIIVATKLLGEIAQRLRQPAVLGELIAGVLLGGSVLGIVNAHEPVLHALAELGVLILLFEIGLHTDLRSLAKVGNTAVTVAVVGVVLPLGMGYAGGRLLGLGVIPALVAGAALTATSIGISARVLSDLGRLRTPEGQVVLGAAVLDDVIGLIILSVVSTAAAGAAVTAGGVLRTTSVAIGFIVVALLAGTLAMPPVLRLVERIRIAGALGSMALAFALLLAWLAASAGSAMIIGAFAAGLVLHNTPQRPEIERAITPLGYFLVPIFFASVGAAVDLRALATPHAVAVGGVMIAVGVAGKVAAGFSPWWFRGNRLLIGVAMVPRGEVGLIFAQMGLLTGAITQDIFGALMLMVLVTTFITPPLLSRIVGREATPDGMAQPGDGGIDDLVAGSSLRADPPR